MKIKGILAVLVAAVMLAGCGASGATETTTEETTEATIPIVKTSIDDKTADIMRAINKFTNNERWGKYDSDSEKISFYREDLEGNISTTLFTDKDETFDGIVIGTESPEKYGGIVSGISLVILNELDPKLNYVVADHELIEQSVTNKTPVMKIRDDYSFTVEESDKAGEIILIISTRQPAKQTN